MWHALFGFGCAGDSRCRWELVASWCLLGGQWSSSISDHRAATLKSQMLPSRTRTVADGPIACRPILSEHLVWWFGYRASGIGFRYGHWHWTEAENSVSRNVQLRAEDPNQPRLVYSGWQAEPGPHPMRHLSCLRQPEAATGRPAPRLPPWFDCGGATATCPLSGYCRPHSGQVARWRPGASASAGCVP
jgi:hypothetical protein